MPARRVRGMLFGVEHPETHQLIGIIRRSGPVDQCGHFCYVDVQVDGRTVTASGAEDRIYPFHCVRLYRLPRGGWPALGWCRDRNTFAFLVDGQVCEVVNGYTFKPIKKEIWIPGWEEVVHDAAGTPTKSPKDHQRDG